MGEPAARERPIVLFLCSANSARSQKNAQDPRETAFPRRHPRFALQSMLSLTPQIARMITDEMQSDGLCLSVKSVAPRMLG